MGYTIEINNRLRIIEYRHEGNIVRHELGEAWQDLLKILEFTQEGYGLLADYRKATFDFVVEDTDVIDDFLLSIKDVLKGKKEAVLVDNPFATVISYLYEKKTQKKLGFTVKTFSTENAAIRWLSS